MIIPVAKHVILQSSSTPTDYTVEFKCKLNMDHYVSANVSNSNLLIRSTDDCDVIIRAYQFQNIFIGYIDSLSTAGNLVGNKLTIKTDGRSNLLLANLVYDTVQIFPSSNSSVTLSGAVKRLDIVQLSQGTFDARLLSTNYATVLSKNTGVVKIKSNDYLSITVEGSGNVIWCSPRVDIKDNSAKDLVPSKIVYYCG
jgi:Putative auto-transporter adhesin, head GIN domain